MSSFFTSNIITELITIVILFFFSIRITDFAFISNISVNLSNCTSFNFTILPPYYWRYYIKLLCRYLSNFVERNKKRGKYAVTHIYLSTFLLFLSQFDVLIYFLTILIALYILFCVRNHQTTYEDIFYIILHS